MNVENQKTILLVDDETIIAMAEKVTLEKFGYEVIIANNGEAAIAAVEKKPAIDLILMDINLGTGIDGTEAAAIILKKHDLPVVFLSSHMEPEVVAKTEKITSYGYVVKASSGTVLDASIKMAFKLFEAKIKEKEKELQMEGALKALRESEESYRVLFSNASDGILLAEAQPRHLQYVGVYAGRIPAHERGGYPPQGFPGICVERVRSLGPGRNEVVVRPAVPAQGRFNILRQHQPRHDCHRRP
jgi:CheY-like chemotaxis protein